MNQPLTAPQWFKNGDHPKDYDKGHMEPGSRPVEVIVYTGAERKKRGWEGDVVRYYRHPQVPGTSICSDCGHTYHRHGYIDTPHRRKRLSWGLDRGGLTGCVPSTQTTT